MAENLPSDAEYLDSIESIKQRLRDIFDNRELEYSEERIDRIAAEIDSGERGFVDVRRALEPYAETNASVGIPADEDPAEDGDGGGSAADDVREFLLQNFPSYAWAVDHPEIGKILREAAEEEWDSVRLRGAIEGTDWWQNTSATARQAKLTRENDPSEWQRQVDAKKAEIQSIAQDMGVRVTDSQLRSLATDALTIGFNPSQLQQAVLDNSNYGRITLEEVEAGGVGGSIAQVENAIEQTMEDWMLGLPDGTKMQWVRDIAEGRKNIDQLKNYATTMAKTNMPFVAHLIDQGLTAREAIQPYQQVAADVLERPTSSIDMMDERFQRALTGEEGELLSIPQAKKRMREQYFDEWNQTQGAQQSATGLVNEIARMFGRRA